MKVWYKVYLKRERNQVILVISGEKMNIIYKIEILMNEKKESIKGIIVEYE